MTFKEKGNMIQIQAAEEKEPLPVSQAATLQVRMEEMINAGFYTCICTANNRICVRAAGIYRQGDGKTLLDCKKAKQPISLETALRCTSACLVAVSKPN